MAITGDFVIFHMFCWSVTLTMVLTKVLQVHFRHFVEVDYWDGFEIVLTFSIC